MEEHMVDLSDVFTEDADIAPDTSGASFYPNGEAEVMADDELAGAFEEKKVPEQGFDTDETIVAKYLHNDIPMSKRALESIAESLGVDAVDVVATIQKGLNYDRLQHRLPGASPMDDATRQWVEFLKEHREFDVANIPDSMIENLAQGATPNEAYLAMKVADYEQQLAEQQRLEELRKKSIGSLSAEAGKAVLDPFEEGFNEIVAGY